MANWTMSKSSGKRAYFSSTIRTVLPMAVVRMCESGWSHSWMNTLEKTALPP